jgi:hypothetical protein
VAVVGAPAPAAEPEAVVDAAPPLDAPPDSAGATLGLAWLATPGFGRVLGLTFGRAGASTGGLTSTSGRFVCASANSLGNVRPINQIANDTPLRRFTHIVASAPA